MNLKALFLLALAVPVAAGPSSMGQARAAMENPGAAYDGNPARPPLEVPADGNGSKPLPKDMLTEEEAAQRRAAAKTEVPDPGLGADKEEEAKKENKGPSDHAFNAMRGALIGALVGSLFGPWGAVIGAAAGGAGFYGISKWKNPDKDE